MANIISMYPSYSYLDGSRHNQSDHGYKISMIHILKIKRNCKIKKNCVHVNLNRAVGGAGRGEKIWGGGGVCVCVVTVQK